MTSDATIERDTQILCRNVNDFIKNPTVLVNSTELQCPIDIAALVTIFVLKVDYSMKSTGG
jgi:hypothetical protein